MGPLIGALLAGSTSGYALFNPNVTPNDYALIQEALAKMPEPPRAMVRIDENKNPRANGYVDLSKPTAITLHRHGRVYPTRDPFKIASTLLHENAHIADRAKGMTNVEMELSARQPQAQFLRDAQARGEWNDKKYLRELDELMRHFQRMRQAELRQEQILGRK